MGSSPSLAGKRNKLFSSLKLKNSHGICEKSCLGLSQVWWFPLENITDFCCWREKHLDFFFFFQNGQLKIKGGPSFKKCLEWTLIVIFVHKVSLSTHCISKWLTHINNTENLNKNKESELPDNRGYRPVWWGVLFYHRFLNKNEMFSAKVP